MTPQLLHQLAKDFLFMYPNFSDEYSSYTVYGCECNDGWYQLLRGLCTEIAKEFTNYSIESTIRVSQIKEKFGYLRVHFNNTVSARLT